MNRASWDPPPQKPHYYQGFQCSAEVNPDYDRRRGLPPHSCPFDGKMVFQGKRYCRRHHPIYRAECEAWAIYRKIEELKAIGFKVSVAPRGEL